MATDTYIDESKAKEWPGEVRYLWKTNISLSSFNLAEGIVLTDQHNPLEMMIAKSIVADK